MHIEDDIAREGEDIAARYHKSCEDDVNHLIDILCSIIAVALIVGGVIALYCCDGCVREKFVADQAAQLDAEGGAQ